VEITQPTDTDNPSVDTDTNIQNTDSPDSTDDVVIDTGTDPEPARYTMNEIVSHDHENSCRSVIGSQVYDLTDWVSQHPGGSKKIISICGKDGSSAFGGQHGSSSSAKDTLANFWIGTLTD
jgi:cytochrome b involved in lipid metabolism